MNKNILKTFMATYSLDVIPTSDQQKKLRL